VGRGCRGGSYSAAGIFFGVFFAEDIREILIQVKPEMEKRGRKFAVILIMTEMAQFF
jgi:hypothetical protein